MPPLFIALRTDGEFEAVLSFLEGKGASGWCVSEDSGDNAHHHWYLETDRFTNIRAFRMALTRAVDGLKGNGSYSAKETDENKERYWQYMAKGDGHGMGATVVWRHGLMWTDEYIEELHEKYWSENAVFKKQKLRPIDEVVLEKAMAAGIAWDQPYNLQKIYIKELFARNKPINLYSVRSHCNLIALKLAPDVDGAVDRLVDNGALL